jgi:hypothetical protein
MLKDFRGVLVSDFYAAYDAIPCPQQKCLIHLIRDLNEDVLKHPYDEELKRLGLAFAVLLRAMVETVDRFGLKSRFLRRHLSAVDRFYRQIGDVPSTPSNPSPRYGRSSGELLRRTVSATILSCSASAKPANTWAWTSSISCGRGKRTFTPSEIVGRDESSKGIVRVVFRRPTLWFSLVTHCYRKLTFL